MAKMWSECPPEEKEDVRKLEKRIKTLEKYISLGYLTKQGEEYFRKELLKEVKKTERKYREI